jgi:hypothetical protein
MERLLPDEPMRDLLKWLPMLKVSESTQQVDFQSADPGVLVVIAEAAETTMNTINLGVGAIGHLLAHSAAVIEDGTICADTIESLGFLLSEISDLSAGCMVLATRCRRETADYQPT